MIDFFFYYVWQRNRQFYSLFLDSIGGLIELNNLNTSLLELWEILTGVFTFVIDEKINQKEKKKKSVA